jgi:putative two-component system response regulator
MISSITRERIFEARLLIIDDLEFNVTMLENLLREVGYKHILGTQDPRLAMDLYNSFKPDLILLDLIMPNIDGFGVMDSLRKVLNTDSLPVVILTADSSHDIRIRALEAGARDFLTKPFDTTEVATRIRNLLEVSVLNKELQRHNTILEQKVRERTAQLLLTQKEIIHRLSRAAEYREHGAGLHLIHISQICSCLSRALGLSGDHCDLIAASSPMHDIGKIGIPDSILLKPGPLNGEEWQVMHTHTILGAEILSGHDSPLLATASEIALTHHERWDGTGYPRRLRGDKIPIEGRIVALADVFDSLISPRPYKEEWPVENAIKEVADLAGSHFDPNLVEKFHEVLPEITQIVAE